jgi:hypothetical protein
MVFEKENIDEANNNLFCRKKYSIIVLKNKFKYGALLCAIVSCTLLALVPSSRYYQRQARVQEIYENPNAHIHKYQNKFSTQEITIAKQLLQLKPNMQTIDKMLAIEQFILDTIANTQASNCDFKEAKSTALMYLQNCFNKTIQADCGAYTAIANLLFEANGIAYRRVAVANIPDTSIGAHTFTEVFVPEKNEWLFTDLTTNKLLLQNKNGHLLNTYDVQVAIEKKQFDCMVLQYQNRKIDTAQWQNVLGAELRCFLPMVNYTYFFTDHLDELQRAEKIKYLLLPKHWTMALPQSIAIHNWWYWIRWCTQYGAILLGLIWMFKRK